MACTWTLPLEQESWGGDQKIAGLESTQLLPVNLAQECAGFVCFFEGFLLIKKIFFLSNFMPFFSIFVLIY